jgi:hypothetical protein
MLAARCHLHKKPRDSVRQRQSYVKKHFVIRLTKKRPLPQGTESVLADGKIIFNALRYTPRGQSIFTNADQTWSARSTA